MNGQPILFFVAATIGVSVASLQAEVITCDGILGNSGEQGAALVRFEGAAASGMGIVCDRYGSLWDRGGAAVNRYAVDGRLLASYQLPSVQADRNSDMIALLGDTLVLRLGGQLYSLSIDAPTGSEVQPMKIAADKLSFSAKDGWVAASHGKEVFLVNGAGEKKAVATLQRNPEGLAFGPDGGVYVSLDGKLYRVAAEAAEGMELAGPQPGERPQFLNESWYGNAWHSTLRRFDQDLQPSPGVVLGGNSGAFIGHVAEQSEIVNGRGLAQLRPELFAISGFGGIMHLLEWKKAERRFEPIRRIGPLPACKAIGLDREDRVWCNSGHWNWNDGPSTPQHLGVPAPENVFGLTVLDNDPLCGYGLMWGSLYAPPGFLHTQVMATLSGNSTDAQVLAASAAFPGVGRFAVGVLGRHAPAQIHVEELQSELLDPFALLREHDSEQMVPFRVLVAEREGDEHADGLRGGGHRSRFPGQTPRPLPAVCRRGAWIAWHDDGAIRSDTGRSAPTLPLRLPSVACCRRSRSAGCPTARRVSWEVWGGRQSFSEFSRKCSLCEMAMLLPASPPAMHP